MKYKKFNPKLKAIKNLNSRNPVKRCGEMKEVNKYFKKLLNCNVRLLKIRIYIPPFGIFGIYSTKKI